MKYFAGVDIGSVAAKAVILADGEILATALVPTKVSSEKSGLAVLGAALENAGLRREDLSYVVATGYGRITAPFADSTVTEISCHAMGTYTVNPNVGTVIDMGGQDCKAIKLGLRGQVADFALNDKCAAGTGRFLGAAAKALGMTLDDLGPTALKSSKPVKISTTCTVFAEAEVLSWLGKGKAVEDILWGVHKSIAIRSFGLLRRVGIIDEITFTGGVANNPGMIKALEEALDKKLNVSKDSHFMGALGAALFAMDALEAGELRAEERV